MSEQFIVRKRRNKRRTPMQTRRIGSAFAAAGAALALEDCPVVFREPEGGKRGLGGLSVSFLIHGGAILLLLFVASLAPIIEETIIPVSLIHEEPDIPEPAPAPRALAERRSLSYAPALQAVAPQIINPNVVAEASPAIEAKALDMDAVSSVAAPTRINRTSPVVVDRVSAVRSVVTARATKVDFANIGGPVVRGPVRANSPTGPSVGPRKVAAARSGTTMGTGKLTIGGGSSVRDGVLSNRDVLGSRTGAPLASVDTAVGKGFVKGPGGTGTSTANATSCYGLPAVVTYLGRVRDRTVERWTLPPGIGPDQRVTLRFRLDVAGSATKVSLVRADDNALGVSAIDALRTASPFPPIPDSARCLTRVPITATFSNPGAA
ncbi:MAG: TonB family protein [Gaiellales bacterium]